MILHDNVASLSDKCREVRRELHKIPELGYREFETQQYIIDFLSPLKPDILEKIVDTGVKAVFFAKNPTETLAFRADMDALKITERSKADYASKNPGRMHACGHDGHMTIQLLTAKLVADNRERLTKNIVFIFQPAEEGGGGAKAVLATDAMDNPAPDKIYGLHVWPQVRKNKVGIRWGVMMAQTLEFDIVIHGRSAHAASPQEGIDAVVIAAELISMLQTAVTRGLDPHNDALLTIGRIEGGAARNVIADEVILNATLRVLDSRVYDMLRTRIQAMLDGFAVATGATFEFNELMKYPCVNNPRRMVEDFYTYLDADDIALVEPVMAAEDYACYQERIPGIFMFLGIGPENEADPASGLDPAGEMALSGVVATPAPPLHSCDFDFDEDCLLMGIEIFYRLAFSEK